MVAGGAEATVTPVGIGGFEAMMALSKRNEEPTRASRPFDRDRDGFVLAEGAGILVIEAEEVALAAGGKLLDGARVAGTSQAPVGEVALVGPDGTLVAIAEVLPTGAIQPRKVFATPTGPVAAVNLPQ